MKQMHLLRTMVVVAFAAVPALAQETLGPEEENDSLNAVVKLEVTTAKPDIRCPWITRTGGGTGSGVVIDSGRILTCAHCVVDANYIRVRKHNEDRLYHGSVLFVDNDADLALVCVEDSALQMWGSRDVSAAQSRLCEASMA